MHDCFKSWARRERKWKVILGYVCWHIWRQRNLVLFEGRTMDAWKVSQMAIDAFEEFPKGTSSKKVRIPFAPILSSNVVVVFSDGAS